MVDSLSVDGWLVERADGWYWKFDHLAFTAFDENPRAAARPYLPKVSCRLAVLASECGLVTEDVGAYMYALMGRVNR